jgi:lysophospholipase L1-like esterase
MQKPQAGPNPILRIGDSLTEQMFVGLPTIPYNNQINGHNANILNSGYMGIKTGETLPKTQYALGLSNPWAVIFQCGTNDALTSAPFDMATFIVDFESNVAAIKNHAGVVKIIILSIPPVLNATCGFDQSRINAMNDAIQGICAKYPGVTFFDLDPYFMCQSTGYARPNYLLDAAHLAGVACYTLAWLEYSLLSGAPVAAPPAAC